VDCLEVWEQGDKAVNLTPGDRQTWARTIRAPMAILAMLHQMLRKIVSILAIALTGAYVIRFRANA